VEKKKKRPREVGGEEAKHCKHLRRTGRKDKTVMVGVVEGDIKTLPRWWCRKKWCVDAGKERQGMVERPSKKALRGVPQRRRMSKRSIGFQTVRGEETTGKIEESENSEKRKGNITLKAAAGAQRESVTQERNRESSHKHRHQEKGTLRRNQETPDAREKQEPDCVKRKGR